MAIEIPNREELNAHFYQFCKDSDYLNSIWARRKDYALTMGIRRGLRRSSRGDPPISSVSWHAERAGHSQQPYCIRFVSKKRRLIL